MATEDKYKPTKVENALDWGKLITGGVVAVLGVITNILILKNTADKISQKRNDPDKYWDTVNKRGCNSAHVVAEALDHVADAIASK